VIVLAGLALGSDAIVNWAAGVLVAILPLGTGAAILRYKLYDLDRIVSRTVAYGLLTLLLGGGYAAVVLGLGQLLGRDSSLVVAAATLAVAAVFQPLRRRVQAAVDRRFNRRRHDAARVIEGFGRCWPWSTRPCSQPGRRCGCGREERPPQPTGQRLTNEPAGSEGIQSHGQIRPNRSTPHRPGSILLAVRCRGRSRQQTTAARS
jgi:hypothetical protein